MFTRRSFLRTSALATAGAFLPVRSGARIAAAGSDFCRATIVVPAAGDVGAKSSLAAATDLRAYLEKATGTAPPIVAEDRLTGARGENPKIFVGPCRATKDLIQTGDLRPEGFIIKVDATNIYIVGGDRTGDGLAVNGTAYGCQDFLERFLGVRWLMPGELGEVVPPSAALAIDPVEIREEPLLWQRTLRNAEASGHQDRIPKILQDWGVSIPEWQKTFGPATTDSWFRHQRLDRRVKVEYGHAFKGWWDRYHVQYPAIFALQPDGTRNTGNYREKLCVSNPKTWELVAREKIRELRADPLLTSASISPNDGGGSDHCSCPQCRAWDPKRPATVTDDDPDSVAQGRQQSLTDRYFRFYNEVGKLVAREMPDRFLGCYAYSIYRDPPLELDHLEKNLLVGFVGFNSYLNDRVRAKDRAYWLRWGQLAKQLFIRPNLFWYGMGLPTNYVRKLAADLQFMAANGMRAADFDGLIGNWGTDGLNYYVAARVLWNPSADPNSIAADYCRAAYGRGAPAMQAYYSRLEKLTDRIAAEGKYRNDDSSSMRLNADKFAGYYTDGLLGELREHTDRALGAIGAANAGESARVKRVAVGLDYTRHVRTLILAAAAVRNGQSTAAEYNKVFKVENAYFASMAMSWSVSMAHDFSYLRETLALKSKKQAA